jgi:hypothetical protein
MNFSWSRKVSKHKAVDVDFSIAEGTPLRIIFSIDFAWDRNTDHAGLNFHLCLFDCHFGVMFYDTRHWDYDNECWVQHDSYGWVETNPGEWEHRP